jgi:hypothetical protein
MVTVGMPSVTSRSSEAVVEWGVAYVGCKLRKMTPHLRNDFDANQLWKKSKAKLYSKAGFIDHLMECKPARDIFEKNFDRLCKRKKSKLVTSLHSCVLAGDGVWDDAYDPDKSGLPGNKLMNFYCHKLYPPPAKE